jgi:parvulin-like peptidyl-prolyl isomerase
VNAVREAVVDERLDEDALREAYQANLPQFTTVGVEHILVADRADAERIASEVTPETFGKAAQRESIDPGSAAQGGSLGSFSEAQFQSQFDPDFVAATLALQAGEISGPIRRSSAGVIARPAGRGAVRDVRDQLRANGSARSSTSGSTSSWASRTSR